MAKPPENVVYVTTYEELARYVRAFRDGHLSLLIIVGSAGLQKSTIVRETMGSNVCWLEGNATAFGMYRELWRHRDAPVVIDDVDGLYRQPAAVRLLKCVCQTDAVKRIAWHSDAKSLSRESIPTSFYTASRVLIIANKWQTPNPDVAALRDRGLPLVFVPSAAEVHQRTARWFWDQEVFDFVGQHLHLVGRPTMRYYVLAAQLKRAGLDWQGMFLERFLCGVAVQVAKLVADGSYEREDERVAAFKRLTGRSRSCYFYHKKKLQPELPPPVITLENKDPPSTAGMKFDLLRFFGARYKRLGFG